MQKKEKNRKSGWFLLRMRGYCRFCWEKIQDKCDRPPIFGSEDEGEVEYIVLIHEINTFDQVKYLKINNLNNISDCKIRF